MPIKDVSFLPRGGNGAIACMAMTLDYLAPSVWCRLSIEEQFEALCAVVGVSPSAGKMVISSDAIFSGLRRFGVGVVQIDSRNPGHKRDGFYLAGLDGSYETNYLIIAHVAYGHLPLGKPGAARSVLIVGETENEIVYHDQWREDGEFIHVDKEQFFLAWRLAAHTSLRPDSVCNGIVAWSQEPAEAPRIRETQPVPRKRTAYHKNDGVTLGQMSTMRKQDPTRPGTAVISKGVKKILALSHAHEGFLEGIASAAVLAQDFSSSLTLMNLHSPENAADHLDDADQAVPELDVRALLDGLSVTWCCETGTVQDRIRDHAKRGADLVVIGDHQALLAPEIAMKQPIALWIERGALDVLERTWDTILVPMDGTPFSFLALQEAIALAKRHGGAIYVIHARQANDASSLKGTLPHVDWQGVSYSYEEEEGLVSELILTCARRKQAQVIVMGTMGVGHPADPDPEHSVTREVIRKSPCSLLIVHPKPL